MAIQLPSNANILAFDMYLNRFFKEETSILLRVLFTPVLLWWKVTNVIPMRPTEFAFKLKRDCLLEADGRYFIKIDRIKVTYERLQKRKKKRPSIPILNKIEITKDIFDLMQNYIDMTKFDTETKTFLSYRAWKFCLAEYKKNSGSKTDLENINLSDISLLGIDTEVFTNRQLQAIINMFYKVIIKEQYKDNTITEQLTTGDTRHLAFSSLILQGFSQVEIAMLGGHTSLEAQDHYVGHSKYYIDSEILNFISNTQVKKDISSKTLKEIVFSNPPSPPKKISECFPSKDGVGYCTLNFELEGELCELKKSCILCSRWWCAPTNANYIKAKEYLNSNSLAPLQERLSQEEEFLKQLIKDAKVVNIGDLVELQKDDDEKIRSVAKKIKGTADEIIYLKKSLLDMKFSGNKSKEIKNS